jgi:hypothetical protein
MKSIFTRGIATTTAMITVIAGSVLLAQEPTTKSNIETQQESGIKKVGDAYRNLHDVTLLTLQ